MNDNNLPNRDMLYIPTLKALEKLGRSSRISQLEEVVIDIAGITDEQLAVIFPEGNNKAGKSKVLYSIAWARSNLKAIGAMTNSERGVWSITEEGKKYLAMPESEAIQLLKRTASAHWSSQQKLKKEQAIEYNDIDEEDIEENNWKSDLYATLKNMDSTAFERLIVSLVRYARLRDEAPPIDLFDFEKLCELLVKYRIGVSVEERTVQDIEINHNFFKNL